MIFEELVCTFPDGVEHTFLYRRGPMTLPDGRLVLFCVAEDITELRLQTNKVLQINEKLQGEYQRAVNAEEAETFLNSGMGAAFTSLSAFSFMVFSQLYTPCVTALGTIKKEAGGWKWMGFSAIYMFAVAWLVSLLIYQIGSLMGF